MRKIYLTIVLLTSLLFSSCATARYGTPHEVLEIPTISEVIRDYYPHLYEYYLEGVLDVTSLKEVVLEDGTLDYRLKYRLVKYRYTDYGLKMEMIRTHFPEVYEAYSVGALVINDFYKFVDEETGLITHYISYSPIRTYYFRDRVGLRIGNRYHMRRYMPGPSPRPAPRPEMRPNNPPRQQPNVRPNNPPRQGGNPGGPGRGGQGRRR